MLKTNEKIRPKELEAFIPIGKLKCSSCSKVIEVAYNGLCERCLNKKPKMLGDVQ